jgi:hypothetical protein
VEIKSSIQAALLSRKRKRPKYLKNLRLSKEKQSSQREIRVSAIVVRKKMCLESGNSCFKNSRIITQVNGTMKILEILIIISQFLMLPKINKNRLTVSRPRKIHPKVSMIRIE